MGTLLIISIVFGGIIGMAIINSILALKCPECKKWNSLKWQEAYQRDKCQNRKCDYEVYAKDFVPPKASYLKMLQKYSPITYKKKEKD